MNNKAQVLYCEIEEFEYEETIDEINELEENSTIHILTIINHSNIETFTKILQKINQLNKKINIELECEEFILILTILENNYQNINFKAKYFGENYEEEELIDINKQLEELLKDIKNSSLSPYEKFLHIYHIVSNYKKYKECEEEPKQAIDLKYILNNDKIVCVGFVELMKVLLHKVGIEATSLDVCADISQDNKLAIHKTTKIKKSKLNFEHHCRTLIHLKDSKYDIDGYFISDPTWDNTSIITTWANALFPFYLNQQATRIIEPTEIDYILGFFDFKDYDAQIEHLINKKTKEKNIQKSSFKNKRIIEVYYEIYNEIINIIKKIDKKKYQELILDNKIKEKPYFYNITIPTENSIKETTTKLKELIIELSHYVFTKASQNIDLETTAIAIINANIYPNENLEDVQDQLESDIALGYPYEWTEGTIKDSKTITRYKKKTLRHY